MSSESRMNAAIENFIGEIPPHIFACAGAIRHDLYHGPTYSRIPAEGIESFTSDDCATYAGDLAEDVESKGGTIEETYTGQVAQALRDFIDSLPCELFYDSGADYVTDCEPEPETYEDEETGETCVYDSSFDYWRRLDKDDIVAALFGKTIAREFN